jgi:hypothetical protein
VAEDRTRAVTRLCQATTTPGRAPWILRLFVTVFVYVQSTCMASNTQNTCMKSTRLKQAHANLRTRLVRQSHFILATQHSVEPMPRCCDGTDTSTQAQSAHCPAAAMAQTSPCNAGP